MVPAWDRITALFLLILHLLAGAVTGSTVPSSSFSSPLVLPLIFTPSNFSHRPVETNHLLRRRQLADRYHAKVTARMELHDDIFSTGYYSTRLYIGTPPQEFALIVDSGSTVTYVPCASCQHCGKHQYPRFQPDHSGTYEPVKCNSDCICDDKRLQCAYKREYAEMSTSSGLLGEDIISFGKESALKPQRAVFGCETTETGDLFNQRADGILGLGRGGPSIMDQLVTKGLINDSFSLCYGGMDIGGGTMVLGGIPFPADMIFSRSSSARSPYYNIDLKEIHLGGKPLRLQPKVFDRRHGTILDSGTTYAYLPEEAFVAFRNALLSYLRALQRINGPDPDYKDLCFSGAGSGPLKLMEIFPKVDMVFGNGQKLTLNPENYLFRHSKIHGAYCLGIFKNGNDTTTLLGGIVVRNTLVTYDRRNERIGFWKTNCSGMWNKLHIDTPQHMVPSTPPNESTTIGVHPPLSPNGLLDNLLPGHIQVGIVTFELSLNMTHSELAPHLRELAKLIAHDLNVDTYQMQLLNFSSEGNSTLIKWAVLPAESAYSISNTTALRIISRLTEHRVHLPGNFGSYQLVEWNVEPPKRSWWKNHLLGVSASILVVVIIGLSALFMAHVKRRRPSSRPPGGTYRPIKSAAVPPEQELRPFVKTSQVMMQT